MVRKLVPSDAISARDGLRSLGEALLLVAARVRSPLGHFGTGSDSRRSERHVVVARIGDSMGFPVAIDAQALNIRDVVIPRFEAPPICRMMHLERHLTLRSPATPALVTPILQHFVAELVPARILQFFLVGHERSASQWFYTRTMRSNQQR